MIARRPRRTRRGAALALALGLTLGLGAGVGARAQHTPDPYNIVGEYNRQYEPFMYANTPNELSAVPNQYRDDRAGNRNANRFQSYLDGLDGAPDDLGRSSAPRPLRRGVPYYQANRQFDEKFQRTYRPNEVADRAYYANQQEVNDKYFQALRETDPKRRAQLFREYRQENLRSARTLSAGRNSPGFPRDREADRDRPTLGPPAAPSRAEALGSAPGRRAPSLGARGESSAPPPVREIAPAPAGRFSRVVPRTSDGLAAPRLRLRATPGRAARPDPNAPSAIMERSERLGRDSEAGGSRSSAPPPLSGPR